MVPLVTSGTAGYSWYRWLLVVPLVTRVTTGYSCHPGYSCQHGSLVSTRVTRVNTGHSCQHWSLVSTLVVRVNTGYSCHRWLFVSPLVIRVTAGYSCHRSLTLVNNGHTRRHWSHTSTLVTRVDTGRHLCHAFERRSDGQNEGAESKTRRKREGAQRLDEPRLMSRTEALHGKSGGAARAGGGCLAGTGHLQLGPSEKDQRREPERRLQAPSSSTELASASGGEGGRSSSTCRLAAKLQERVRDPRLLTDVPLVRGHSLRSSARATSVRLVSCRSLPSSLTSSRCSSAAPRRSSPAASTRHLLALARFGRHARAPLLPLVREHLQPYH